ncbi:helix-turn-helix domain-containing protein [Pontibacter sp. SGAir0037]|uniref:helix-turn-helix domain-containing protein n=1 Tax=Pontibacter sp. SGAir0037 TaxID=2571030 RepID=UPI0010CD36CF|nr:helix-turn-helix transcriptional regulator [Pontibacter sp. SGAir0037]QCR22352.1 hypothetical protein C1N53_08380 [Pontibacter sp. SGAir0037]
MGKEVLITPTDLYIINRVRALRNEADISQKKLSKLISPSEDTSMIGKIESDTTSHKYTDHHLNIIANILNCSIHDFYPEHVLSDFPQKKIVDKFPQGMGPTGMLNVIIEAEEDYLKTPRTAKQITALINGENKESRPETDFTAILARKVEAGVLKRMEVEIEENGKKQIVVKFQKV